ncbi:MAG TPA: hypothetical protein VE974_02780 [Thermoanaerobaculia bacterium]|nr:hypothetical protein [Thermoanaerobaculia bacterium]
MLHNRVVNSKTASLAETQPTVKLDPEAIVEQIRLLRSQMEEVIPLTPAQKRILRAQSRKQSDEMLAGTINVLGALDNVALALGLQPEEVRQLQTDWSRGKEVAGELRALLNGVDGANLVRRQRLALISAQAYSIGTQLARDPANAVLVPHIQEVKRLKSFSKRRKAAENPQSPTPDPAPGTTTTPKP